jgi:hypothetical protein
VGTWGRVDHLGKGNFSLGLTGTHVAEFKVS